MSWSIGTKYTVNLFGQSHAPCVGATISGIPAGYYLDLNAISQDLKRRQGGKAYTTPRKEQDTPRIVSGLNTQGKTCGAPLCVLFENTNTHSSDYTPHVVVPRPGHCDLPAYQAYGKHFDNRGGGIFSGRLTLPLCFAGAVAKQFLKTQSITISAHLLQMGQIFDTPFSAYETDSKARAELSEQINTLQSKDFPCISPQTEKRMKEAIHHTQSEGNSIGSIIECVATGVAPNLGDPRFEGIDSLLAHNLISLPAVKGIEFGLGFAFGYLFGSEAHDEFGVRDSEVTYLTNACGGIQAGFTTGHPILLKCAIKPTPSIAKSLASVNLDTMTQTITSTTGRHDPCIGVRAVSVIEAMVACTLFDVYISTYPELF